MYYWTHLPGGFFFKIRIIGRGRGFIFKPELFHRWTIRRWMGVPSFFPPLLFSFFCGILKRVSSRVIALKRDLYRKGGGEEDFRGRFLDFPRFFFLSFKRYYYRRNRIPMSWTSDFLFENICTHVWKKEREEGKERKEKGKRVSLIYVWRSSQ